MIRPTLGNLIAVLVGMALLLAAILLILLSGGDTTQKLGWVGLLVGAVAPFVAALVAAFKVQETHTLLTNGKLPGHSDEQIRSIARQVVDELTQPQGTGRGRPR